MSTFDRFTQLVAEYDAGHVKAASKNKRVYRNPYAAIHYAEAIARARDLVGDGWAIEKALTYCFESSFPPLKKFLKDGV